MTQATHRFLGDHVDYTAPAAITAGDVVQIGPLLAHASSDVASGETDGFSVYGIKDVVKVMVAVTAGDHIYWDDDGDPVNGTAGTGAATTDAADHPLMGVAVADATSGAETVRVRFQSQPRVKHFAYVAVEDLAADGDIAARPIFALPNGGEIIRAGILSQGSPTGIDDSNTCVVALQDGSGNAIVSTTYDSSNAFPDGAYEDLGSLTAANALLAAGEHVELSVTNGTSADTPAFVLVLEYLAND